MVIRKPLFVGARSWRPASPSYWSRLVRPSRVLRHCRELDPTVSVTVFADKSTLPACVAMEQVACRHRDADGFVYLIYAVEPAFG